MDNKEDNNNDTQAIIIVTITANYCRLNEWQSPPFHPFILFFFFLHFSISSSIIFVVCLFIGRLFSLSLSSSLIAESQSRTTSHFMRFPNYSSPITAYLGIIHLLLSPSFPLNNLFSVPDFSIFSSLTALLYSILVGGLKSKESRNGKKERQRKEF